MVGEEELECPTEAYLEEQQQDYGASEYNINWEEVKMGKSAGMPGKWVSPPHSGIVMKISIPGFHLPFFCFFKWLIYEGNNQFLHFKESTGLFPLPLLKIRRGYEAGVHFDGFYCIPSEIHELHFFCLLLEEIQYP